MQPRPIGCRHRDSRGCLLRRARRHLRGYEASSGKIIWDVDTKREYTTVNGVKANGGSLDGPGAVIVGGMLLVNSG